MLETGTAIERSRNKEMERMIGEVQLHLYGNFLENYNTKLITFKNQLNNVHNNCFRSITVENKVFEDISLLELIHSDNKLLSRILASLASICEESNLLIEEAQKNYYIPFIFYIEEIEKNSKNLLTTGKLIEILQKLNFFVNRVQHVITLLLKQLCAILGKNLYSSNITTSFPEPLDYLADLLVCLTTLDGICEGVIADRVLYYHKMLRRLMHNPSQIQIPLDQLHSLDKCLSELESKILSGKILQHTMEKCIDEGLVITMKNCNLSNEFLFFITQMVNELEKDKENIYFTRIWLQINVMFVFHYYLFGNSDKKMYKRIYDINKKTAACTLYGNIIWYPEKFLIKHIPSLAKTSDIKLLASNRIAQITLRSQTLPKEAYLLSIQAYTWMNDMMNIIKKDMSNLRLRHLQKTSNLIIDGIRLIKKISELIKWITNLHVQEKKPMAKSILLALCRLIEVLKSIQFIFVKNMHPLVYILVLIGQHLSHKILTNLDNIKKSYVQDKAYKEQQLDILSSLNVTERALKGPNTSQRILIAKLSLSASGLLFSNLSDVRSLINNLEVICNTTSLINKLCDCSFLYWHQALLSVYFSKLIDSKVDLSKIYLLLDSFSDCVNVIGERAHSAVVAHLKNDLLQPLNQLVETNLRLQTHLHLQLPSSDPLENPPPIFFKHLLPACFDDSCIHLKEKLEHYLSTTFYNLTTVILHDWRTYGEMRQLALLQYGLNTIDDNLPMQTLEQGLDVLEIMRNIHVFVGRYMYNLNNQLFIQENSNNKHLNTINISRVANSIRAHGIGIMNTTVNFTYQFLRNKFYIFSQFMFDEQIKSRLLKDLKFFNDHKNELNQMYPYERADKFNFGIRRLGLNEEGLSCLDLFRKLITQIGNAMGYVRMIKSGGRRCLADATCFIPDLKMIDELDKLLDNEILEESTRKAIAYFKRDVNNLADNFEEATEYFKLLVNVFIPKFRNMQNIHLKNFYLIVPPLTINFVEHLVISKERLFKKIRSGVVFTDDGFAMGLAYIIELLNQSSQLNSLHWFQSVKVKHAKDRKSLNEQKAATNKEDDKLQQTLALTEKRLNEFEKEFQLLFYSFNSSRIFFQS